MELLGIVTTIDHYKEITLHLDVFLKSHYNAYEVLTSVPPKSRIEVNTVLKSKNTKSFRDL